MEAPGIEPGAAIPQTGKPQRVRRSDQNPLARALARETEKVPSAAPPADPDLARFMMVWPKLPATAKRMILAAVAAAEE